jgi:CBS domain containing-hemolysin-like protein
MIGIISGVVLILLALLALALQRLYSSIPSRELKRLARRGDHLAAALYRPVSYGASTRLLLWSVAVLSLAVGVLALLPTLPMLAGFVLVAALLTAALVLMPSLRLTVRTAQFAAMMAPGVVWILGHSHPFFGRAAALINKYREISPHSQLYEKEDLQHLLALQKEQVDNRIGQHELETAERALAFDDRQAADIVHSGKDLHLVDADDTVGPVLLDRLHGSGQTSFLVYKDAKENVIGSLSLRDAVKARHDGRVFDLIRHDITYVHEDFSLRQVMSAFRSTGHNLAIVINSFEEFVGVITFDGLLQELLGDTNTDYAEGYDNRSAVAAYKPRDPEPEAVAEEPAAETVDTASSSPEATEVIE